MGGEGEDDIDDDDDDDVDDIDLNLAVCFRGSRLRISVLE